MPETRFIMCKVKKHQTITYALRVHTIIHTPLPRKLVPYQPEGSDVLENATSEMYLLVEPADIVNNVVQTNKIVLFRKERDLGGNSTMMWSLAETAQAIPVDLAGPIPSAAIPVQKPSTGPQPPTP